jgi:hypothetical protein
MNFNRVIPVFLFLYGKSYRDGHKGDCKSNGIEKILFYGSNLLK